MQLKSLARLCHVNEAWAYEKKLGTNKLEKLAEKKGVSWLCSWSTC